MCFQGSALDWFHRSKKPDQWPLFKTDLLAAFRHKDYEEEYRRKLLDRRQLENKSYLSYCHAIIFLCSQVDEWTSEKEKARYLLLGLNSVIVSSIYNIFKKGSQTTAALINEIRDYYGGGNVSLHSSDSMTLRTG